MLVERENELNLLDRLFNECLSGRGRIAAITGTAACGKTELLHTFVERTKESGTTALIASGARAEQHLPLSMVNQLFRNAPLSPDQRERMARASAYLPTSSVPEVGGRLAQVVDELCEVLLDLERQGPIVIGIDDAHHVDASSLQFLLYCIRRTRAARIMVIFSYSEHRTWTDPLLRAELVSQPNIQKIKLTVLSRRGGAQLVSGRLGADARRLCAPAMYEISGGNPSMLNALIDDHLAAGSRNGTEVSVGNMFRQSVMSLLYRGGPSLLRVAHGLAILNEPSEPEILGRLIDVAPSRVEHHVNELTASGLLWSGRFRRTEVRATVLESIEIERKNQLHRRAAGILYSEGTSLITITRHVAAAGDVDAPWVLTVLRDAAKEALLNNEVDTALDYLQLAYKRCETPEEQAEIASILVRAEWRTSPSTAARHLKRATAALRLEDVPTEQLFPLIRQLLRYGLDTRVGEVLDRVSRKSMTPEARAEMAITRDWLTSHTPTLLRHVDGSFDAPAERNRPLMALNSYARGLHALTAVLTREADESAVAAAEETLRASLLDDASAEAMEFALRALLYSDRSVSAASHCDRLLTESSTRDAPGWQGVFSAIRAEISLRQSDLEAALQFARAALAHASPRSWGVALGPPLGTLVLALTRLGRHEEAAERLGQPVPEGMFRTRFGLHYLHARGQHYLATGRNEAALIDFLACGDLMTEWSCDLPSFISWRIDAGAAYLRLGDHSQAKRLAEEQLAGTPDRLTHTRGLSLRFLAANLRLEERPALLAEAADLLLASGDRLESTQTLLQLRETSHLLDLPKMTQLAEQQIRELLRTPRSLPIHPLVPLTAGLPEPGKRTSLPIGSADLYLLSTAEQQVAALAAQGHTNREIAAQLFISVSTVEQHLTRVYKKLHLKRRTELPTALGVAV